MVSDKVGLKLHDLHARGTTLTDADKKRLEEWYARKFQEEAFQIKVKHTSEEELELLQRRVDETLEEIAFLAKRIKKMEESNRLLRLENQRLMKMAEQKFKLQAA